MGVFNKVFAGSNHSFALIDSSKIRRNQVESFEQIPAPEFLCEKKLTSHRSQRSQRSQSQDDLDNIPKDTLGWILEYQNDENLLEDGGADTEDQEIVAKTNLPETDLSRYTLPQ